MCGGLRLACDVGHALEKLQQPGQIAADAGQDLRAYATSVTLYSPRV
jgi:hypothetical protein